MTDRELQGRLAENVRNFRKARRLTQAQLAEKADVSEDTIKSIELVRAWTSASSLAAIATALDVDAYELFLPVPSSFEIESSIREKIVDAAKEGFSNFLDSLKRKL